MNNWEPGKPVTIETESYFVRSLTPSDADETYTSWWNDAEIQKGFNNTPRNWDTVRAAQHISTFDNRNRFHLGIFTKKNGKIIGYFAILLEKGGEVASTNVCIGEKEYWGKGVASEIREKVLDFIFGPLGLIKVEGKILGRNLSSIAIYKGLGFKPEGVLRKHINAVDGGRADIFLFGLLKEEWEEMKKKRKPAKKEKPDGKRK